MYSFAEKKNLINLFSPPSFSLYIGGTFVENYVISLLFCTLVQFFLPLPILSIPQALRLRHNFAGVILSSIDYFSCHPPLLGVCPVEIVLPKWLRSNWQEKALFFWLRNAILAFPLILCECGWRNPSQIFCSHPHYQFHWYFALVSLTQSFWLVHTRPSTQTLVLSTEFSGEKSNFVLMAVLPVVRWDSQDLFIPQNLEPFSLSPIIDVLGRHTNSLFACEIIEIF